MTRAIKDLLHKGSVKDIYSSSEPGELIFKFSDRYSVFDWGEMPDALEGKGNALAKLGSFFFDFLGNNRNWQNWDAPKNLSGCQKKVYDSLCSRGLGHHFLGQLEGHANSMVVSQVDVPKLPFEKGTYDYQAYREKPQNTLVPLEVIFRFGVPEGSSLFERVHDSEYRRVLGLQKTPEVGEWLSRPVIEYSTKLESTDRYLSYSEAQRISGLLDSEFVDLHAKTEVLAMRLFDYFKDHEIELWDGKVEWAFCEKSANEDRDFILVDSIGPDELRLSHKGMKLSKEFLRSFYRGGAWLKKVNEEKSAAKSRGERNWKDSVLKEFGEPPPLNETFLNAGTSLYQVLAQVLTNDLPKEEASDLWQGLVIKMQQSQSFIENSSDRGQSEVRS